MPLDPTFRSLVRVYDFDPAPGHFVMIRPFKPDELQVKHDELLKEISVPLKIPISTEQNPGYAQLAVNGLPELSSNGTVRIEVSPGTPGLRFWAFASVTNNETQHVTIVTPQ